MFKNNPSDLEKNYLNASTWIYWSGVGLVARIIRFNERGWAKDKHREKNRRENCRTMLFFSDRDNLKLKWSADLIWRGVLSWHLYEWKPEVDQWTGTVDFAHNSILSLSQLLNLEGRSWKRISVNRCKSRFKTNERERERGGGIHSYKQPKFLSIWKRNRRRNKIWERIVFSKSQLFSRKDKYQTKRRFTGKRKCYDKYRIR